MSIFEISVCLSEGGHISVAFMLLDSNTTFHLCNSKHLVKFNMKMNCSKQSFVPKFNPILMMFASYKSE